MNVDSAMDFMVVFNIFVGAYLLYYAIVGKGRLYEGDYPKEMMEEHQKLLRKFCWLVGAPMLGLSVLEYMYGFGSIWSTISIVYVLGAVVIYFIIFTKKFRKYLYPEKTSKGKNTSGKTAGKKKKSGKKK